MNRILLSSKRDFLVSKNEKISTKYEDTPLEPKPMDKVTK